MHANNGFMFLSSYFNIQNKLLSPDFNVNNYMLIRKMHLKYGICI